MTLVTTITPTTSYPTDWQGKPQREVRTRWTIGQNAEGHDVVVELSTTHSPESKRYRSTLTWATLERRDGYTSWCWASDYAYGVLANQTTPRYSAKGLWDLHHATLAFIEDGLAGHVFDEAFATVTS